jgi:hypothetical protein
MKKAGLLLFALLLANSASAEWVLVSESSNGATTYTDPATILRQGGTVKLWILMDHKSVQKEEGDSYLSSLGRWEVDCTRTVLRQTYHILYPGHMGAGKSVWSGDLNRNFQPAAPFTNGGELIKFACDKR